GREKPSAYLPPSDSQLFQLFHTYATRADDSSRLVRPVAVTAPAYRQFQLASEPAQLAAARAASSGILRLDGPESHLAQFGPCFPCAIIGWVCPGRNAPRATHAGNGVGDWQPYFRYRRSATVAKEANEGLTHGTGSPCLYEKLRQVPPPQRSGFQLGERTQFVIVESNTAIAQAIGHLPEPICSIHAQSLQLSDQWLVVQVHEVAHQL